jgi:hypothetical protein
MSAWRQRTIAVQRSCSEAAPGLFDRALLSQKDTDDQACGIPVGYTGTLNRANKPRKGFGRVSAIMAKGRMKIRRIRFAPAGFASVFE